jgi:hypothetical protein
MNKVYNYLFLLVFTMSASLSIAQDEIPSTDTSAIVTNVILPKANNLFSTRGSFTVPNPISNKAFKKSFIGIYQVNGCLNLALYKGLFIGVVFSDALFQIDKNIIPNKTYAKQPYMNVYNAGIKVGGDFYIGEKNRIIFSADVSVGQSYVKYSSFSCKDATKKIAVTDYKSPFVGSEISMIFLVEPNWGIGPTIGYSLIKRSFNPYDLCLDDWSGYSQNSSGATQYFNFGFICHYSFGKK